MRKWLILASLLLFILAAAARQSSAAPVTITNITTINYPGADNTFVFGVSGSNVVGTSSFGSFEYDGSTFAPIKAPATGIDGNNIVGFGTSDTGNVGFLYNGSTYTILNDPLATNGFGLSQGTFAQGISGDNVVGYYFDASKVAHGFVYNMATNSYTTLDDPKAGTDSGDGTFAEGISGNNIVGYYVDPFGRSHGFLYNGTTYTTLSGGLAYGISGNYIVGNNGGTGSISPNSPIISFIFDGSTYTSVSNYKLYGISGNKVVGSYVSSYGVNFTPSYSGFVATIPEPSSLALALIGVAGAFKWGIANV